jgi:chondroitin 4-sulfotransferase 11
MNYIMIGILWKGIDPKIRYKLNALFGRGPSYLKPYNDGNYLFIHIPKTAGTSVGEIVAHTGRPGHWTAEEYRSLNGKKFEKYFKFCFIRNPWDRLVSSYFYLKKGGKSERDAVFSNKFLKHLNSFEAFVYSLEKNNKLQNWVHFLPQTHFICDCNGKLIVDFVGRFENLSEDFEEVRIRLGLSNVKLEWKNQSTRKDYKQYYNEKTNTIVGDLYKTDIDLFGYKF